MVFIDILLIVITLCSLIYIFLLKKNIRSITGQLRFILTNVTNTLITLPSNDRELEELLILMNDLLSKNREIQTASQNFDANLKSMINNVTHDLRTPLTVAKGYLQLLKDGSLDEETRMVYLEKAKDSLEHLSGRIDILFEYTTFQEHKDILSYEKINISRVMEEELLLYYQMLMEHHIDVQLKIEKNLYIYGCPDSIKSIIQNCVGNVIKHGRESLLIDLSAKNHSLLLSFTNKAKSKYIDVDSVFNRFYTEDMARFNQNTGLGLPIVKELVQSHEGHVEADFSNGEFRLSISLPLIKQNNPNG